MNKGNEQNQQKESVTESKKQQNQPLQQQNKKQRLEQKNSSDHDESTANKMNVDNTSLKVDNTSDSSQPVPINSGALKGFENFAKALSGTSKTKEEKKEETKEEVPKNESKDSFVNQAVEDEGDYAGLEHMDMDQFMDFISFSFAEEEEKKNTDRTEQSKPNRSALPNSTHQAKETEQQQEMGKSPKQDAVDAPKEDGEATKGSAKRERATQQKARVVPVVVGSKDSVITFEDTVYRRGKEHANTATSSKAMKVQAAEKRQSTKEWEAYLSQHTDANQFDTKGKNHKTKNKKQKTKNKKQKTKNKKQKTSWSPCLRTTNLIVQLSSSTYDEMHTHTHTYTHTHIHIHTNNGQVVVDDSVYFFLPSFSFPFFFFFFL